MYEYVFENSKIGILNQIHIQKMLSRLVVLYFQYSVRFLFQELGNTFWVSRISDFLVSGSFQLWMNTVFVNGIWHRMVFVAISSKSRFHSKNWFTSKYQVFEVFRDFLVKIEISTRFFFRKNHWYQWDAQKCGSSFCCCSTKIVSFNYRCSAVYLTQKMFFLFTGSFDKIFAFASKTEYVCSTFLEWIVFDLSLIRKAFFSKYQTWCGDKWKQCSNNNSLLFWSHLNISTWK